MSNHPDRPKCSCGSGGRKSMWDGKCHSCRNGPHPRDAAQPPHEAQRSGEANDAFGYRVDPYAGERAQIVAIICDVIRSFQDCDGDEVAAQVGFRLDAIERGDHLAAKGKDQTDG